MPFSKPVYMGWSIWKIWEGGYLLRKHLGGHHLTPTLEEVRKEDSEEANRSQKSIFSYSIRVNSTSYLYISCPFVMEYRLHKEKIRSKAQLIRT